MDEAPLRTFFAALLFSVALFVLSLPSELNAALLYLEPAESSVHRGDTFTTAVRIDTDEGECVNVADVVIKYDPSLRAVDISRGDSILSLWVEDPKINEDTHTISFAGGIPGGYCGRVPGDPRLTNVLIEIIFRVPGLVIGDGGESTASVWVDDMSQVLLHDQFGTRAPLRTAGATYTLLTSPGSQVIDDWSARVADDDIRPADFPITLTKDDTAFSGKYFITFNSQDKQSGIDHYEVMEEPFEDFDLFIWGRADAPWISAESPYVLEDQSLNSTIRVKAIDKAGNETIAVLVPDEALRSVSLMSLASIIAVVLLLGIILLVSGYLLWRRKQRLISSYDDMHDS